MSGMQKSIIYKTHILETCPQLYKIITHLLCKLFLTSAHMKLLSQCQGHTCDPDVMQHLQPAAAFQGLGLKAHPSVCRNKNKKHISPGLKKFYYELSTMYEI